MRNHLLNRLSIAILCCTAPVLTAMAATEESAPTPQPNVWPAPVAPPKPAATPPKPARTATRPEANKLAKSNLTAAQILEKNAAARGGVNAWRAVKSIRFTGKMDVAGPQVPLQNEKELSVASQSRSRMARVEAVKTREAERAKQDAKTIQVPFVMELKRPNKQRVEITHEGKTAVQVYDGEKGWKVQAFQGSDLPEPYTDIELKYAAQQSQLDGPLIDAAAKGNKVTVEGMEPLEGKKTYRLLVDEKNGQKRRIWVDAGTFLEAQSEEVRNPVGIDRNIFTKMSDYKMVGSVKVPHRLENHVGFSHRVEKILIQKVDINPALKDDRFAKPQ